MQYDVSTPEEYMNVLEDDWRRETVVALRRLIQEKAPGLQEGIRYKMLSYEDEQGQLFGLNAQKHYVSFYVGDAEKIDPHGELLAGLGRGKGCIRFTKSVKVEDTKIDDFIARAAQMHREGEDTDC